MALRGLLVMTMLCCAASLATAQDGPKLTARELFYTPVTSAKPETSAKPTRQQSAKPKPADKVASERRRTTVPEIPDPGEAQAQTAKQQRQERTNTTGLQNVAGLPPLALRYSLLKGSDDNTYREVDPEMVFRSGDRIRVSVQANDNSYLYIVQQGSSKNWDRLFPSDDIEHGSNRIERNREYVIPAGGRFTFDDQPGTERLFIVVSRQPVQDMEGLIYSLSSGSPARDQSTPARASKVLLAQARPIDDSMIERLRSQLIARDLVFEKVDESKPGPKKETAMYVATQDRSPNARVVVDLNLNHR